MALATPFTKILIANRGEIALRVMRTARALGYRTVAVYSTADAGARHVEEADQAVCIGPPPPQASYLRMAALIDAARLSGADAVHPGYGFLAENAGFARACRDAGLVFIGPSPDAIAAMGDKAGAKARMAAAGVPCIPGYQGPDQGADRLAAEAARIGFPVMVKATAGGGGRGMRLVASAAEFSALLHSAQSEARSAFGNADVILERAIVDARHVEIQVFADRHGNAVHLGERDCSVQRRHQKLIEESPSPAVGVALRRLMAATAVAAVKAIAYEGAGTLEFLLDSDGHGGGNFFFMEMNTRLQVEHPVTEAVTGLDLVEWQLRVAAGDALPLGQDDVHFTGHAIEVRLCAEDAVAGFLPHSGTMAVWRMPPQLRVDHALRDGAAVVPDYDSMLAKLVAHGRTREEARRKLLAGLQDAVALGVTTNQVFLQRSLAHAAFVSGQAGTAFVASHLATLLASDGQALVRALAIAALLLCQPAGPPRPPAPDQLASARLPVGMVLQVNGTLHRLGVLSVAAGGFEVAVGGDTVALQLLDFAPATARLRCDGIDEQVTYHREGDTLLLHDRGHAWRLEDMSRAAAARPGQVAGNGQAGAAGSDGKLRAAMTGRVVAVLAAVGDSVAAGQPVLSLEAMKMEHLHTAPCAGRLAALHVRTGDPVASGSIVAEVAPGEPAAAPAPAPAPASASASASAVWPAPASA